MHAEVVGGYDTATGVGWPRPRMVLLDDPDTDLPVPYIAAIVTTLPEGPRLNAGAFDRDRADAVADDWRCQVCGTGAGYTAYAPIPTAELTAGKVRGQAEPPIHVSGGPVCSARCVNLALATCPHFAAGAAVISFTYDQVTWGEYSTALSVRDATVIRTVPALDPATRLVTGAR